MKRNKIIFIYIILIVFSCSPRKEQENNLKDIKIKFQIPEEEKFLFVDLDACSQCLPLTIEISKEQQKLNLVNIIAYTRSKKKYSVFNKQMHFPEKTKWDSIGILKEVKIEKLKVYE